MVSTIAPPEVAMAGIAARDSLKAVRFTARARHWAVSDVAGQVH